MTNQQQTPREQRTPRYSVRLGRERIDEEHHFECRRCLRETSARDGSAGDAIDIHGDLCSECWLHIFSLLNERIVPPRGDTSGRRGGETSCWEWDDSDYVSLDGERTTLVDGSAWRFSLSEWVCIRGPR